MCPQTACWAASCSKVAARRPDVSSLTIKIKWIHLRFNWNKLCSYIIWMHALKQGGIIFVCDRKVTDNNNLFMCVFPERIIGMMMTRSLLIHRLLFFEPNHFSFLCVWLLRFWIYWNYFMSRWCMIMHDNFFAAIKIPQEKRLLSHRRNFNTRNCERFICAKGS